MIQYSLKETETTVELIPNIAPTVSIIWLHGLGANGYDFVGIAEEFKSCQSTPVHFIFPHAPYRAITINNGNVMRGWYDIITFDARSEDAAGIQESRQIVDDIINKQIELGIPAHRLYLGGFSQGGAIALHTGLRFPKRLGGILALSTYLPLSKTVPIDMHLSNRETPIFFAHGTDDPVIPLQFSLFSQNFLEKLGYKINFYSYPMGHSVCGEEILNIDSWLNTHFIEPQSNH